MRVAIVGKGEGWKLTPLTFDEIWGVNEISLKLREHDKPAVTAMFAADDINQLLKVKEAAIECSSLGIPVYTFRQYPWMSTYKRIQKEQLGRQYFTNTICYMVATAIQYNASEIHLYGVNMASDRPVQESKGVEYWLGVAEGKGIEVQVHGPSKVLKNFKNVPYGEF